VTSVCTRCGFLYHQLAETGAKSEFSLKKIISLKMSIRINANDTLPPAGANSISPGAKLTPLTHRWAIGEHP